MIARAKQQIANWLLQLATVDNSTIAAVAIELLPYFT